MRLPGFLDGGDGLGKGIVGQVGRAGKGETDVAPGNLATIQEKRSSCTQERAPYDLDLNIASWDPAVCR